MHRNAKIIYLTLFVLLIVLYGTISAIVIMKGNTWRHAKAQEYLEKAKNTTNESDKLLLFEKAAVLTASEQTYLTAGISALNLGQNTLAERYLSRVKTDEGYFQLANAYYNLEEFETAATYYQKSINKQKRADNFLGLAKSKLKMGDTSGARAALLISNQLQESAEATNILVLLGNGTNDTNVSRETDPTNKAVLVYNELITLGYPQSANVVMQEATSKGLFSRDTLLVLANEAITKRDYSKAYDYLVEAKRIDSYYPQIYQQLVIVCERLGKTDEGARYQATLHALSI